MKDIYYFLLWHWKKYQFDMVNLLAIAFILLFSSLIFGSLGFITIGAWTFVLAIVLLGLMLLKIVIYDLIVEPIMKSFKQFKREQEEVFNRLSKTNR